MFGQQSSLFGGSTSSGFGGGGLFGSKTSGTTGFGGFGSTTTTIVGTTQKFEPVIGTDQVMKNGSNQTTNTKLMVITAMKPYESKTLEELRIEDYLANRKGGNAGVTGAFSQTATASPFGGQQQTGGGLFGQNTSAKPGGLFGSTPTSQPAGGSLFGSTTPASGSLFGQTATTSSGGLFGAKPATSSFGGFGQQAATGSPFGGQQQTGGGLFGQNNAAKPGGLFGSTATSQPAGGSLFGSTTPAGGSLFGQTATTSSGGLFGAKPATSSFGGFGQQAATGSPFGGQQQTGGGLFGQSTAAKPGGLFGSPATSQPAGGSLFGSTAPAGGSLFGQTATTSAGGLFGAKPATSTFGGFGQTATASPFGQQPAGGLFSQNNAAKPGGLFGATPAAQPVGGSLFGGAAPAGGSLFGSTAPKPGGLFGTTTTAAPSFGAAATTVTQAAPTAQPIVLGSDVNQFNVQKAFLDAVVSNMPYGDSPLLKGALSGAGVQKDSAEKEAVEKLTVQQRQAKFLASKKVEMPSTIYGSPRTGLKKLPPIGSDLYANRSLNTTVRSANNSLKSVYTPPPVTKKVNSPLPGLNKSMNRSGHNGSLRHHLDSDNASSRRRTLKTLDPAIFSSKRDSSKKATEQSVTDSESHLDAVAVDNNSPVSTSRQPTLDVSAVASPVAAEKTSSIDSSANQSIASPAVVPVFIENGSSASNIRPNTEGSVAASPLSSSAQEPVAAKPHPAGIVLTLSEYYTEPSLEEMAMLTTADGICELKDGLTIGRLGYGSIFWPGPLSLSNVVLDEVVSIRAREVIVYPDDSNKPPLGTQLNRPAEISLERVWPVDKSTNDFVKNTQMLLEMGFHERLERNCKKMGATFKDYRADTGTWVFAVSHFSKYGFDDDDDDDVSPEELAALRKQRNLQKAFQRAPKAVSSLAASELDRLRSHDDQENVFPEQKDDGKRKLRLGEVFGEEAGEEGEKSLYLDITSGGGGSAASNRSIYLNLDESQVEAKRARFDSGRNVLVLDEDDDDGSEDLDIEAMMEEVPVGASEPAKPSIPAEEEVVLECRLPKYSFNGLIDLQNSLLRGKECTKSNYVQNLLRPRAGKVIWHHDLHFIDNTIPLMNELLLCRLDISCDLNTEFFTPRFRELAEYSSGVGIGFYGTSKNSVALVDEYISASKNCAERSVMELCKVLFTIPDTKKQKEAFGEWLRSEIADDLNGVEPKDFYDYLCRGDVKGAKCQALKSGKLYMAMQLAAFANKTEAVQRCAKKQLKKWNLSGAEHGINESTLKITMLLAGEMVWTREVLREGAVRQKKVAVNDGLSWMQTLGLIMWFSCGPFTSLRFAMDSFREAASLGLVEVPQNCIEFELLQLATMPGYDIRHVLKPLNVGKDALDCHLIWHLWKVISSAVANGFPVSIPDDVAGKLHTDYGNQLVALGYPELALFVFMHVTEANARLRLTETLFDAVAPRMDDAILEKIQEICGSSEFEVAMARLSQTRFTGHNARNSTKNSKSVLLSLIPLEV
ncbi:hypothetical protein QR680_012642 [Steinernema hermaphroditum]|uniref:Nuclear pore complex protein Nup98-Nup96 n=1 Tax=Steinernema hermaphroditum TaxID=289476 RepID=A0AA39I2N7_9BILA|nr:hypothetical protein QR680_012642 [Steinernema hermaphroditum]